MKKLIYIFSVLFLALTACQSEIEDQPVIEKGDYVTLNYTMNTPDFMIKTKADPLLSNLYLMTFDENGEFLGRVAAAEYTGDGSTGTGKARVSIDTRIIHFIANYDWTGFNDDALLGEPESTVIPSLTTTLQTYWGRVAVTSLYSAIHVDLLRNFAKIEVVDETADGAGKIEKFNLTGFALGHYATKGTIATFGETANAFTPVADKLTLPTAMTYANQSEAIISGAETAMQPKYTFETNNPENNPTFVIIKNSTGRYYKLHLLKDNNTLEPWKIERNYQYKVVLKSFEQDPYSNGVGSFDEALSAAPANNLYAEIIKESPSISASSGNRLRLDQLVYLYTSGRNFSIQANYYPNGSSTPNNADMEFRIVDDPGNILSGVALANGKLTGTVKTVTTGQQEASVRISKAGLSRIVTIISTQAYSFNATSPIFYAAKDADATLQFSIPEEFPAALLPVKCKINAATLYPVAPNKNILVVQENGTYYYIYEATTTGAQEVKFKASLAESSDYVTIQNEYFNTANISLLKTGTTLIPFGNMSVTNARYGIGNQVTLTFTIPEGTGITFPVNITITKPTSLTGQTSYTATTAGVQTITYTTNVAESAGNITIAANGFIGQSKAYSCTSSLLTKTIALKRGSTWNNGAFITATNLTLASDTENRFNSIGNMDFAYLSGGGTNGNYQLTIKAGVPLDSNVTISYCYRRSGSWLFGYTYHYASKEFTVRELITANQLLLAQ